MHFCLDIRSLLLAPCTSPLAPRTSPLAPRTSPHAPHTSPLAPCPVLSVSPFLVASLQVRKFLDSINVIVDFNIGDLFASALQCMDLQGFAHVLTFYIQAPLFIAGIIVLWSVLVVTARPGRARG